MGDTAEGSREGSQFGRYQLGRLLGRGGMGEVYEAWDTVKEWPVALKLMSPAYSQDPVFRKRLQREARTAGRLQEPHVVPTDSTNGCSSGSGGPRVAVESLRFVACRLDARHRAVRRMLPRVLGIRLRRKPAQTAGR